MKKNFAVEHHCLFPSSNFICQLFLKKISLVFSQFQLSGNIKLVESDKGQL